MEETGADVSEGLPPKRTYPLIGFTSCKALSKTLNNDVSSNVCIFSHQSFLTQQIQPSPSSLALFEMPYGEVLHSLPIKQYIDRFLALVTTQLNSGGHVAVFLADRCVDNSPTSPWPRLVKTWKSLSNFDQTDHCSCKYLSDKHNQACRRYVLLSTFPVRSQL